MNPTSSPTAGFLPEPTLRRLPWYLAYVSLLRAKKVKYVSSTAIAKELNVDSSQIAKDLSFLNIKGKTRIGYDVARLETTLCDFLGFNRMHNAVIVGVGSLGAALLSDRGLANYGLNVVAGFDVDAAIVGKTINGVPVYSLDSLVERRPQLEAEIGIITVPVDQAQETADTLIAAGFRALWNFTPVRIRTSPGIVVVNTSIYAHLAVMYNRLDQMSQSNISINDFL